MRSEKISDTDKYRAFVAYDPEGYYLEWDVFKDVPDNQAILRAVEAPLAALEETRAAMALNQI